MVLLIVFRFRRKLYSILNLDKFIFIAKLSWLIIFGSAFLFMIIGFIYDIAMIINEKIGTIIYPFIYFIVCFFYIILSYFDYYFCEKSLNLIFKNMNIITGENHEKKESKANLENKEKNEEPEGVIEKEKEKQDSIKEKNE